MDSKESSTRILSDKSECKDAVASMVKQADRHVALFTQQLEPLLYNHSEVCDVLSRLARKNKLSTIRILTLNSRNVMSEGHCLITLAQRLSSFIQIRNPQTPELQRFNESWLIVDDHSMCRITNPDRYEGKLIENNRLEIRNQLEFFNNAWENSSPDTNVRQLNI